MEKKTVVIIADALDFQYAGIKVYLEGLVSQLQANDTTHDYIMLRADEDFRDYAGQVYVKSYVSQFLHPKSRLLVEIPQAIKQLKPDVVVEPCHFGPFRISDTIKKVTFIHDITPVSHPQFHAKNSVLLHKLLLPGILKRANLIITNSEHTKSDLIREFVYSKGKTEVIYPGTQNLNRLKFSPIDDIDVVNQKYILHVGTLEPRKNLSFLLKAFEEIKLLRPELKLIISGKEGWKNKPFFDALKIHPNREDITVTGYLEKEQIVTLYRHAECMLFTSNYEGFGIPLLEAMEIGCPIITADNSAQKEVCKDAAVYINDFVASDWANAFLAVAENQELHQQLIQRGKDRAKSFKWRKSAEKFDRHITEIYEHDYRRKK
jgi:glycosyltransferase involved in cell wall biosynthesis